MMDGEPHVSYAMAIFDNTLNLTNASPNDQKMRVQTTGIGRLNFKSKQVSSIQLWYDSVIICRRSWR